MLYAMSLVDEAIDVYGMAALNPRPPFDYPAFLSPD
jgi:hypothetical protein